MPLPKRVLYYGLLAALTLLAIEGMARAAYWLAFDDWYGGLPAVDYNTPLPDIQSEPWRIQHPFYGYTAARQGYELNVMPPRERREGQVTIGLVGGSVAEDVTPHFQRALSRYFTANNWPRRPVVREMDYGTMKQPQQVLIAANTLLLGGHYDLIVNLDGYNDLVRPVEEYERGTFPIFPHHWSSLAGLTHEESILAGRIGILRVEQGELAGAASYRWLRPSAFFGLLHRYRWERRERQIIQLNHELAAKRSAYSLDKYGPRRVFRTTADLSQEAAAAWYRSSLLLAAAAELAGAEYYHFLQPNQYVPGAKPLTAEELACCYTAGGYRESLYRTTYPLTARLGEKLQRQAVNYFDLSYIFQGNDETLYRDECCHLNDRGSELLAAVLVERLEPALLRAAAGEGSVSGLAAAALPAAAGPEELLIDAEFQVYRRGRNRLIYIREVCASEDLRPTFFLHIAPADRANLPANRREAGFENWDFQFERSGGGIINGHCVVERRLPAYSIASIRTGQFTYAGATIWAAEYHFPK